MSNSQKELIGFSEKSIITPLSGLLYGREQKWFPDSSFELSPAIAVDKGLPGFSSQDMVDLHQLDQDILLYFTCTNPHAFYTLRRNSEDTIKIWRDWNGETTGLVGKVDDLVVWDQETYDQQSGNVVAYPGLLFARGSKRIQPRINMPYFKYDDASRALLPDETWSDIVIKIYIQDSI